MSKKNYTFRFEAKVVEEPAVSGNVKDTARKHGIQASQIREWRRNIDLILEQVETPKKINSEEDSKTRKWKSGN